MTLKTPTNTTDGPSLAPALQKQRRRSRKPHKCHESLTDDGTAKRRGRAWPWSCLSSLRSALAKSECPEWN